MILNSKAADIGTPSGCNATVVWYKPTLSKTFKFSVSNCAFHSLRKPVDCADLKVLEAWKCLLSHRPSLEALDDSFGDKPHLVFLMPKVKIKSDPTWFQARTVGKNSLRNRRQKQKCCENPSTSADCKTVLDGALNPMKTVVKYAGSSKMVGKGIKSGNVSGGNVFNFTGAINAAAITRIISHFQKVEGNTVGNNGDRL